jgi:iron complex transport system permease protein
VTNNNLASPSTLGFDGAAVLGIIIAHAFIHIFGIEIELTYMSISISLSFVFIWYLVDKFLKQERKNSIWSAHSMKSVVLSGLAFNLFVGAIFSIVQFLYMAMNYEFPTSIWFGSLKQYSSQDLFVFIPVFIALFLFLVKTVNELELLNIGTSFSLGLNKNVPGIQKRCLIISFVLTGMVISYYGVFSFLGLVFPHVLRNLPWWRKSIKGELLLGPFVSGLAFGLMDFACYHFEIYGAEFPVGMISSVIGAGILILMVLRSNQYSR